MMINFLHHSISWRAARYRLLGLVALLSLAPSAIAAPKYKKSTVVDFEGALVEGKSRKPYSTYLTQQKDGAFGDLHRWQLDLDKRLLDSQTKLDKTQ
jgi:hypothetical protein